MIGDRTAPGWIGPEPGARTERRYMAVPKKRTSKQRKRKRRTHHRAEIPAHQACPRCGGPRRPHRVCPECGTYGGREVVRVEEY